MALPDQNKWLSLFWSGRAIQCLKSFLLEKSRPFLYKTPYATSQIQTEQIQRSKRVMGGIRTPTDIGLPAAHENRPFDKVTCMFWEQPP